MSSQFPPRGRFDESPLHELIVRLIRGRFSGSAEVRSEAAVRIFHFDSGNLCAATSDHPAEQIEVTLERTIAPTLNREQKRLLKERQQAGQPLARALVDLGALHAAELLAYNRNLAEDVLRGALADSPEEFRLNPGRPGQYNPVPFDPLVVVRDSILNDVGEDVIHDRLGDDSSVFIPTGRMDGEKGILHGDPELGITIANLDGRKSIGELAGRLGMNPDRTRRLLYFLYLIGWIAPARTGSASPASVEGFVGTRSLSDAYAAGRAEPADDAEGILKLLEKQEKSLFQPSRETSPTDEKAFKRSLDREIYSDPGERNALLERKGAPQKVIKTSRAFTLLGKLWLPAVVVVLIALGLFIALTSMPGQPAAEGPVSFYQKDTDTSQLSLDEQFVKPNNSGTPAIELQLQPQEKSAETESQGAAAQPRTNEPAQKTQEIPPDQEQPSVSATTKTEKPAIERTFPDFASAQSEALHAGHSGHWEDAAALWRAAVKAEKGKNLTLLIRRVERPLFIADIFEKFANSAHLREKFFVLKTDDSKGYMVCWGLFTGAEEARAALASLPDRIKAYAPAPFSISAWQ
jgi:hypothetical protein